MLLIQGLDGLGLTPLLATKAGGGAHVDPTTDEGPSFYIEPTGPYGYTSFGITSLWYRYTSKLGTRIWQTINGIRELNIINTKYPWRAWTGCALQRRMFWEDILTPIGVINLFGVTFPVSDLQNGKLERTFVPNAEQKFLIDYAIFTKSQAMVASTIRGKGCGKNEDVEIDHTYGAYTDKDPTKLVFKAWNDRENHASVGQMLRACDDYSYTTWIDGYGFNPIQPTEEELTEDDGLRRYYERGGFLLWSGLATGQTILDSTGRIGMRWSLGYYLCPDSTSGWYERAPVDTDPSTDQYPTSDGTGDFAQGGIPAPALQFHSGEGAGWAIRVQITPDAYSMSVTPKDPGTLNKILSGLASIMETLHKAVCDLLPVTQPIAQQQLLSELCTDASGKTCAKGSPGCKCTPPSLIQKDAFAASAAIASYACGVMRSIDVPTSTSPPPQLLTEPPPPEAPKKIPWIWIALGGAGIAALVIAKRKR